MRVRLNIVQTPDGALHGLMFFIFISIALLKGQALNMYRKPELIVLNSL